MGYLPSWTKGQGSQDVYPILSWCGRLKLCVPTQFTPWTWMTLPTTSPQWQLASYGSNMTSTWCGGECYLTHCAGVDNNANSPLPVYWWKVIRKLHKFFRNEHNQISSFPGFLHLTGSELSHKPHQGRNLVWSTDGCTSTITWHGGLAMARLAVIAHELVATTLLPNKNPTVIISPVLTVQSKHTHTHTMQHMHTSVLAVCNYGMAKTTGTKEG